jgi:hypothetical protein
VSDEEFDQHGAVVPAEGGLHRADEEFDQELWQRLGKVIGAANRGDTRAHTAEFLLWAKEVPLARQQRAGLYLWYLLQYRITDTLRRRPTQQDLHEIALSAYPRFRQVVTADETLLEDVLRKVFEFPQLKTHIQAGQLAVLGSAVLGVLMDHPAADMEAARPHLIQWWQRNVKRFREQGLYAHGA